MTKSATRIQDKDTQRRLSVVQSTEDPTKYGVVILNPDGSKIRGPKGEAATVTVGTTTTGQPGTNASVTNSGTTSDAVLNFTIPRGDKGDIGTAATIAVGTTTTGQAGTSASVINSGTSSAAVFDFVIPKGDKGNTGDAATITVGSTTTGQPGTDASVVNSGTSGAAVLDFTIPQGIQGEQGETGNGIQSVTSSKSGKITTVTVNYTDGSTPYSFQVSDGQDGEGSGDVLGPSSATDGHFALFDGTTGKLIKNGGAIVDALNSSSTTDALSANQGKTLNTSISTINGKIPSAASTSNQLADKNYVDTSINSVTAYYITKNAAGDQFATYAELSAATTFYSGGVARTPTRNDYTIVLDDETHNDEVTRYIYNNGWEYQYTINESPLTQAQLDALNSGITSGKVSTYDGYATTISGKQDALSLAVSPTSGHIVTWGANNKTFADGGAIPTVPSTVSSFTNDAGYITSSSLPGTASSSTAGIVKLGSDTVQSVSAEAVSGIANRTYALQVNSSGQGVVNVPWTDTTYTSKTAASGGTDVSLVTTGEKYTWNNKQNALTTQTAYTSKGTSTKVATITTNTLGQVTGITETSITFPVSSVNGNTGAVTVSEFSPTSSGTTGQYLKKTSGGYDWADVSGGDVLVSDQANNILTSGMKIWCGTEANYSNLGTYDSNTLYLTV